MHSPNSTGADALSAGKSAFSQSAEKAANMGRKTASTIDDTRQAAADAVDTAADYVRENDVKGMLSDVQRLLKNNPRLALMAAAGLGFLVARIFSRD